MLLFFKIKNQVLKHAIQRRILSTYSLSTKFYEINAPLSILASEGEKITKNQF
jgi:hypothetical protein